MKKVSFILVAVILALSYVESGKIFAQTEIAESDRKAIWEVLDELGQAIVREDINSIMARISPNMPREEYNKIKEAMEGKFSSYDYTEYKFSSPAYGKIEVLEPAKKLKFKVRYWEKYKYKSTSGSGSSSGLTSSFTVEKIDGKWLILNTDFYTKARMIKIFGIAMGLFVLLGIFCFIFWLLMLIDCIKRDFPGANDKIMWILLLIFTQIIGAIIYYFVIKRKAK